MGVLNVTPDSFSDGDRYFSFDSAVRHGFELVEQGADIVDIGGESTRPGAAEIPAEEEMRRVIPVIEHLARRIATPISIDTRKGVVAKAAVDAGAKIINDVSGLAFDPEIASVTAKAGCALVLMHMRGTPRTMTELTQYRDVVEEVFDFLRTATLKAERRGVARSRIIVDPGLGFAKTTEQSFALLRALPRLSELGYPVLIGASRKSFIRATAGRDEENVRAGTIAINALAVAMGASIIRVHEPRQARAAIGSVQALTAGGALRYE